MWWVLVDGVGRYADVFVCGARRYRGGDEGEVCRGAGLGWDLEGGGGEEGSWEGRTAVLGLWFRVGVG